MFNKNLFFVFVFQSIIVCISLIFAYVNNIVLSLSFLLLNYILSFFIVNVSSKNFFNVSSFFLLGFGFFILGRVIVRFLSFDFENIRSIFCADFFFVYCMHDNDIAFLLLIINMTILFFSLGHVVYIENNIVRKIKKNPIYEYYIKDSVNYSFIIILYISVLYLFLTRLDNVFLAISKGYMALYSNQAEEYQAPIHLLAHSLLLVGLSLLINLNAKIEGHVKIIFIAWLVSLGLSVLMGSRGGVVNIFLFLLWYFYRDKNISIRKYIIFFIISISFLSGLNYIASSTGSRDFGYSDSSLVTQVLDFIYGQGGTLMLVNSSLYLDEFMPLAYLKTIIPGIQILYGYIGISERYLFDWASFLARSENIVMYEQGFGLGWSVLSDFYLLSFRIVPLYCIMFFLFGIFLNYIKNKDTIFCKGVVFILVGSIFSLTRSSISPIIFSLFLYVVIYFIIVKRRERCS